MCEDVIAEGKQEAAHLNWRGTHLAAFLGLAATDELVVMSSIGTWRIAGEERPSMT